MNASEENEKKHGNQNYLYAHHGNHAFQSPVLLLLEGC
jgi:hypothetical protein